MLEDNEGLIVGGIIVIVVLAISIPTIICYEDIMDYFEERDNTPEYCGVIYDKDWNVYFTYVYIPDSSSVATIIPIAHYKYYFDIHDEFSGTDVHVSVYSSVYDQFEIGDNVTVFQSGRAILND